MILEIINVTLEDNGYYPVNLKINGSNIESRIHYLRLTVEGQTKPEMVYTNMQNSTLTVVSGTRIELICNITSHPKPIISFPFKNKHLNSWLPVLTYKLYESNQVLVVGPVTEEEGRIMCTSESARGVIVAYVDLTVTTWSGLEAVNCFVKTLSLNMTCDMNNVNRNSANC